MAAKLLYNVIAYEDTAANWATDETVYPVNTLLIASDTGIIKKGNGTDAYAEAMEQTLIVAQQAADLVRNHPNLELLCEPELSIVAFTRKGWVATDYQKWSDQLLEDQIGFVTPSSHQGQPILRFAIVNPWTTMADIEVILATL